MVTNYDEYVKRVLSNRYILAWILKYTTSEFKEYSIDKIALECIDKDIQIGKVPVYPGKTNTCTDDRKRKEERCGSDDAANLPDMILGDNIESKIPGEGIITFDIRFHAILPDESKPIRLLVNIEAQKAFHLKYDLITRAIFYCARMLSAQLDTEFQSSQYGQLKKVYSIWICMNSPQYIGNAISEYKIEKKDIFGVTPDHKLSYDKLCVVMICLNEHMEDDGDGLLHLLNTLLSTTLEPNDKAEILSDHYGIAIDNNLGKELSEMCNLSEAIEEKGMTEGEYVKLICQAKKKAAKNISIEACAEMLEEDVSVIRRIYDLLKAHPEWNERRIFAELNIEQE